MESVSALPSRFKLWCLTSKCILKRALAGIVPRGNLHLGKCGFAVPFQQEAVEELVNDHVQGRADYAHHLWILLMLGRGHWDFIDLVGPQP